MGEKFRPLRKASKRINNIQPKLGGGVTGHTEISSGRESDGAHLGTVGEAGALELLSEEATDEVLQPLKKDLVALLSGEGDLCQTVKLVGGIVPADHII